MPEIFGRTWFTLVEGFGKRRPLYGILAQGPAFSTTGISPATIKQTGATIVALDYDGVLAPHGVNELGPEILDWMKAVISEFGEANMFILTNKPKPDRIAYIHGKFPRVRFIGAVRKKPFPDGLQAIADVAGCKESDIVLLDDRLLTGGLAALLAGSAFIYVKEPLVSLKRNFVAEVFFILLRYLERQLVRAARYL